MLFRVGPELLRALCMLHLANRFFRFEVVVVNSWIYGENNVGNRITNFHV